MIPFRRQISITAMKIFDLLVMILSFCLATAEVSRHLDLLSFGYFFSMRIKLQNLIILMVFLFFWQILFSFFGLYESRRLFRYWKEVCDIIKATTLTTVMLWAGSFVFNIEIITPVFLYIFWVASTAVTISNRIILRYILSRIRLSGRNLRYMLIVGTNFRAIEFARRIEESAKLGFRIIGFVDEAWVGSSDFQKTGYKVVATLTDFPIFLRDNVVDEVLIVLPLKSHYEWAARIARSCEKQGIIIRHASDVFNLKFSHSQKDQLAGESVDLHYTVATDGWPILLKRLVDILVSVFLLILLLPLLFVVAVLIKIDSPGPAVFVQERVGLNKRRFRLYKFRSMGVDAEKRQVELEKLNEASGPVFKIKKDPRVTRIGKFLRKTSIDEMLQLVNVLMGDMSLVGPRPLPIRDYNGFEKDWQRRRFSVRPGITCLWQTNGRSDVLFDKWMELDLNYIDHWSLWLDFKILVKTIQVVLKRSGAV